MFLIWLFFYFLFCTWVESGKRKLNYVLIDYSYFRRKMLSSSVILNISKRFVNELIFNPSSVSARWIFFWNILFFIYIDVVFTAISRIHSPSFRNSFKIFRLLVGIILYLNFPTFKLHRLISMKYEFFFGRLVKRWDTIYFVIFLLFGMLKLFLFLNNFWMIQLQLFHLFTFN